MTEDQVLELIINNEGKYQDNPKDRGNFYKGVLYGTNYGITPATAITAMAWGLLPKTSMSVEFMKSITKEQAKQIYLHMYYKLVKADTMLFPLSYVHTDTAIHHGCGTANKFLQNTINYFMKLYPNMQLALLKVDGLIGNQTLNSLKTVLLTVDIKSFCKKYLDVRNSSFTNSFYMKGWNNRIARIAKQIGV